MASERWVHREEPEIALRVTVGSAYTGALFSALRGPCLEPHNSLGYGLTISSPSFQMSRWRHSEGK